MQQENVRKTFSDSICVPTLSRGIKGKVRWVAEVSWKNMKQIKKIVWKGQEEKDKIEWEQIKPLETERESDTAC